ncbi:MAG: hypothetical protein R2801_06710 [Chitinophagales bacterium]
MESPLDIKTIVAKLNKDLPLHSMWDGFWISRFKGKELNISCSFDRSYYRNYDIIFKDVIFFNLPSEWRDTDIYGDDLIRLSNKTEFGQHHPNFNTEEYNIFAIDIHFNSKEYSFFVVSKRVYLFKCEGQHCFPEVDYKEPFTNEPFPCTKNRVL